MSNNTAAPIIHIASLPVIAASAVTAAIAPWPVAMALALLALIIAGVGCFLDFQSNGGAQSTSAVPAPPPEKEPVEDVASPTPEVTTVEEPESPPVSEIAPVTVSESKCDVAMIDCSPLVNTLCAMSRGDFAAAETEDIQGVSEHLSEISNALEEARKGLGNKLEGMNENGSHMAISCETLTTVLDMLQTSAAGASEASTVVSGSSGAVSGHVSNVATAMEEMTACIREISKNTTAVSDVASAAVSEAESANTTVSRLNDSAQRISTVVTLISDIADTTRLLALNAAIEAVRAGEAGKGFSVVASEVKDLARQTADATEQIGATITAITSDCEAVNAAIGNVEETITKIHTMSTTVASAVEEQSVTTTEVNQSLHEAATGVEQITESINEINGSLQMITSCSNEALGASRILEGIAHSQQEALSTYTFGEADPELAAAGNVY